MNFIETSNCSGEVYIYKKDLYKSSNDVVELIKSRIDEEKNIDYFRIDLDYICSELSDATFIYDDEIDIKDSYLVCKPIYINNDYKSKLMTDGFIRVDKNITNKVSFNIYIYLSNEGEKLNFEKTFESLCKFFEYPYTKGFITSLFDTNEEKLSFLERFIKDDKNIINNELEAGDLL